MPLAASTVRQIHYVMSGAVGGRPRGWFVQQPCGSRSAPKHAPPERDPPSPAEAAKLVDAAFDKGNGWDTLVWLVMTTGGSLLGYAMRVLGSYWI